MLIRRWQFTTCRMFRAPHKGLQPLLWSLLFLTWSGSALAALTHAELLSEWLLTRDPVRVAGPPADFFAHEERIGVRQGHPSSLAHEENDASLLEHNSNRAATPSLPDVTVFGRDASDGVADDRGDDRDAAALRDAWVREAENAREHRFTGGVYVERERPTLAWLKAHQSSDGRWSASGFHGASTRPELPWTGNIENWGLRSETGAINGDLEVTALALLTFVGSGYDHKEGNYRKTCRQAILWLRADLDDWGRFMTARGTRDQALATAALCEVYGLSGDTAVKPLAERAVKGLLARRVARSGWGEDEFSEPDLLSTCYAVFAIKTALMAGVELDKDDMFDEVGSFLDQLVVTTGSSVRAWYTPGRETPPGSTVKGFKRRPICAAAWVVTALFIGHVDLTAPAVRDFSALLAEPENLPAWKWGRVDFEYWWIGSLAVFQVGGASWKAWKEPLSRTLQEHQRGYHPADKQSITPSAEHGSWDPVDMWLTGGRVASTALAALGLEVYFRYLRLQDD